MTDVTESEDAAENALLPPALSSITGLGTLSSSPQENGGAK